MTIIPPPATVVPVEIELAIIFVVVLGGFISTCTFTICSVDPAGVEVQVVLSLKEKSVFLFKEGLVPSYFEDDLFKLIQSGIGSAPFVIISYTKVVTCGSVVQVVLASTIKFFSL